MIGWSEKIINPPGIQKPARRSLFEIIGAVGGRVKADALRAFNAHFPYLADGEKLAEHGAALHPLRVCSPRLGVRTHLNWVWVSLWLGVKAHYGSE
jgi:hypothetical protein